MNPRWLLIRRLRGPVFLLTFGVTALLNQWDVLSFAHSWPLYLIVAGVMTLLERAALAGVPLAPYPGPQYTGYPPPGQPYGQPYPPQYQNPPYSAPQGWAQPAQPQQQAGTAPGTAIVPADPSDITPEGRR